MRWVVCAVVVLGLVRPASAADLDILRGSQSVGLATYTNWTGFYVGGQWGYSDGAANFNNASAPPIRGELPGTTVEIPNPILPALGIADHTAMSYGGFLGYNSQWQNLVLGIEGNFNHTTFSLHAPTGQPVIRGLSDGAGNNYTAVFSTTGAMSNLSYFELRGRAGLILGSFLPYGFVGPVIGIADVNLSTNLVATCKPGSTAACAEFSFSASSGQDSAVLYGAAIGGGLDYAITQNIFLRGEFEYLRFIPFADVVTAISSARVGAGVKF